jgi:hypothetical protein
MKIWIAVLLAICANVSFAGLGGRPAELGPRQVPDKATRMLSSGSVAYTQVERKLDSGIVVREFLDEAGTVFAVAWAGPFLPDLKEILGTHFDAFVQDAGKARGRTSRIVVKRNDVVIVSGGHMGSFTGKAWIPAQLPAGFDPASID